MSVSNDRTDDCPCAQLAAVMVGREYRIPLSALNAFLDAWLNQR